MKRLRNTSIKVLLDKLNVLAQLRNQTLTEEYIEGWVEGLEDLGPEQIKRGFKWAFQNSNFNCMPQPGEVREHGLNGEQPALLVASSQPIKPVPDPFCRNCFGLGWTGEPLSETSLSTYMKDCECLHMPLTSDALLHGAYIKEQAKTLGKEWALDYVATHFDRYCAISSEARDWAEYFLAGSAQKQALMLTA